MIAPILVIFLILFVIALAVMVASVAARKRWAEMLFGVVGVGAVIALIAGIDAMNKEHEIPGAILIATGLLCLLGIAIAIKAFEPRP